jgi:hypothetical protein
MKLLHGKPHSTGDGNVPPKWRIDISKLDQKIRFAFYTSFSSRRV